MLNKVPGLRERVYLEGREEQYLVVWVDQERRVADLLPVSGSLELVEEVPWARIRTMRAGL